MPSRDQATLPRITIRGWGLRAYWLFIAPTAWERHQVKGKPGWVLNARQPNGGLCSVPARTKLGAWLRLLRNRTGWGYTL